ncbi:hypothetical protein GWI33_006433 [Rhynchophorus ferrugineus]|uniref:RAWUL domain-containing protein n=1 Tax=Rhynchophorus ferrugineus TaxID=354439 RepID=A0A834IF09_RHYFE|nr:hypothetical protein GWI33_006433 [Rhynchophorus ferrugineus]
MELPNLTIFSQCLNPVNRCGKSKTVWYRLVESTLGTSCVRFPSRCQMAGPSPVIFTEQICIAKPRFRYTFRITSFLGKLSEYTAVRIFKCFLGDDSTPGAIRIPGLAINGDVQSGTNEVEEGQEAQMKRYLLCPGMCRIEVLKKFVRNKYNVDTSQFFIDILYKRVPLPDHYTLIDIGYIYSWQRNELMKFFFRIIDLNATKRTESPTNNVPLMPIKPKSRNNGLRLSNSVKRKVRRKSLGKRSSITKYRHDSKPDESKLKENPEMDTNKTDTITNEKEQDTSKDDVFGDNSTKSDSAQEETCNIPAGPTNCDKNETTKDAFAFVDEEDNKTVSLKKSEDKRPCYEASVKTETATKETVCIKTEPVKQEMPFLPVIKQEPISPEKSNPNEGTFIFKLSKDLLDDNSKQIYSKPVTKSYTSITLNRSENVEIITKIQPVSNKDGHPIGHHIIKQTIKKGPRVKNSNTRKTKLGSPKVIIGRKAPKKIPSPKASKRTDSPRPVRPVREPPPLPPPPLPVPEPVENLEPEDEKSRFFKSIQLKAVPKVEIQETNSQPVHAESSSVQPSTSQGQKRKNSSPLKIDRGKVSKQDARKPVKIILQERPVNSPTAGASSRDTSLQSLIDSCKINIPSSLSITIKESSEERASTPVAPPVKNYIEILKLPDEPSNPSDKEQTPNVDNMKIGKLCDDDSEQKVDQDLSEIAKSLTEKIPMSTTVSHIVGPKQQFQIPVKTNAGATNQQLQPSPVPELNKVLSASQKEALVKLSPRSPQTFQKIFEESLRKTPDGAKSEPVEHSTPAGNKRNISDIASQLIKKTKSEEQEKKADEEPSSTPKMLIPRLPHPKSKKTSRKFEQNLFNKLVPQTVASLHSSSLGMNYTVSVGQKSPSKTTKVNGTVSPIRTDASPKLEMSPSESGGGETERQLMGKIPIPRLPHQTGKKSYPSPVTTLYSASATKADSSSPASKHDSSLDTKPPVSPLNEIKSVQAEFKVPSPSLGSPKLPDLSSSSGSSKPRTPSSKCSPKSSPLVKHMYTPNSPLPPKPVNRHPGKACGSTAHSKLPSISPKPSHAPSKLPTICPKPAAAHLPASSTSSSITNPTTNEIIERYNIQNLSQLTATLNFNPALLSTNQIALQQAMLLKHFEIQNRQNWLNRNQTSLTQYEKYLQSMSGSMNGS